MKRALYIGSFDPFTNGHYEIIRQAEDIFNELVIVLCQAPHKKRFIDPEFAVDAIRPFLGKNTTIHIRNDELTSDIMKEFNCDYLIRGLRNTSDWLYEEKLFETYKLLMPEIKVMYLRSETNISSTFVRELMKRNKNFSAYTPYNRLTIAKDCFKLSWW